MREVNPIANANLSFSEALRRFEALTLADQLVLLALVLREELDPLIRSLPQPPARAPINGRPFADSSSLQVAAARRPKPKSASLPEPAAEAQATLEANPIPTPTPTPELKSAPAVMDQAAGNELQALAVAATLQFPDGRDLLGDTSQDRKAARAMVRVGRRARAPDQLARSIAVTMIVSFSLALGVMLWQGRFAGLLMRQPDTTESTPIFTRSTAAAVAPPAMQSPPRIEVPRQPIIQAKASTVRPDAIAKMPVKLWFFRRVVQNDPSRPDIQGRIFNTSSDPMTIEVLITSERTLNPSQIQVDVGPKSQKGFGQDDGLDIRPNDHITLKSSPYADLITSVP